MKIKFPDLPNGTKFRVSPDLDKPIFLKLGCNSIADTRTNEFYEDKWSSYSTLNCYPITEK